jgi:hypothetical protein
MAASLVVQLIGQSFTSPANDEKATAFELYDAGLRQRLDLCVRDKQLIDCRQASAPAPAPAQPDEDDVEPEQRSPAAPAPAEAPPSE